MAVRRSGWSGCCVCIFCSSGSICRIRQWKRRFTEPVPDETTVCRFRPLLERHELGQRLFDEVQRHLAAKGLKVATGTIVDATIINAPASTKNANKTRDPEMHQTRKGNQWYFGMKAHFGVDSRTKLIHAAVATPASVADSVVLPDLLHGKETRVRGDQAYRGQGDPAACPEGERLHQPPLSLPRRGRRGRAGEKPHQIDWCGPRSSIRSAPSSGCLALSRCAIVGWRRKLIACS